MAHTAIKIQVKSKKKFRDKGGIKRKMEYTKSLRNEELNEKIISFANDKMLAIASKASAKNERQEAFEGLLNETKEYLGEEMPDEDKLLIKFYFGELQYHVVRDMILSTNKRLDGRGLEDIRPLTMETNYLPSPHGSALFTRGETQSLTTVT